MKIVNNEKINNLLTKTYNNDNTLFNEILQKASALQRLSLEDVAYLLQVEDLEKIQQIYETASNIKNKIYGRRVVLFAPLYINNYCVNNCSYCAFRIDNSEFKRTHLSDTELQEQVTYLLKEGHKRILMVAGEAVPSGKKRIDYYINAIDKIYKTNFNSHTIKRVNINVAPLDIEEFKELKGSGIGTYQLFQETYHNDTYKKVHPSGPKSDPDNRLGAIDRAFKSGIDDVGLGVLYGLYNYKFETLAMLEHIEYLENTFNIGPHTISVPRIEQAQGINFDLKYKPTDEQFKRLVAILRLAVPYTGIILSTRERATLRDELLDLGVSQVSAGSSTSPGGYGGRSLNSQFFIHDHRSLDEVIQSILKHNYMPSFCTACYRKERTGETFMNLAKPGTIKEKCNLNALITLKEYLDDFALDKTKEIGYKLIESASKELSQNDQQILQTIFTNIKIGKRDEYI